MNGGTTTLDGMMDSGALLAKKTYSCRRCRYILFKDIDLSDEHLVRDECSLLYLSSIDLLSWVKISVDEVGWTRGKLYCPQCEARLGAFSFLHFIMCQCNQETMPAIYCVRSKVDEMVIAPVDEESAQSLMANSSYEVLGDAYISSYGDIDCSYPGGECSSGALPEGVDACSSSSGADIYSFGEAFSSGHVCCSTGGTDSSGGVINGGEDETMENALTRIIANDVLGVVDDSIDSTVDGVVHDEAFAMENALTRMIFNDALGVGDDSIDETSSEAIIKEMEKQFQEQTHPDTHPDNNTTTCTADNKSGIIRRRNSAVTTYSNTCFDPQILPAYPEVYDEAEFSSRLQECDDEDVDFNKCEKKVFYTSHRLSPHLSCCRRCQLLHEQLLRRSENHQRHADTTQTHRHERASDQQQDDGGGEDDDEESDYSGSDESVIYAEMKDVQRRLRDLQGYLRDENQGSSSTSSCNHRRGGRRRKKRSRVNTNGQSRITRKKATNQNDEQKKKDTEESQHFFQQAEEEPSEQHQCPVCLDILYEPYKTAGCSHVFCAPCLRQIHKVSRRKPVCPLCRHRIYEVHLLEDLQEEVELLHPELYRKRLHMEMNRPINNYPLPNPDNVRFDPDTLGADTRLSMQHIFHVMRVCLMIFVMVLTYLINNNGGADRGALHRRYVSWIKYAIFAVIGAAFAYLFFVLGSWFSHYAVDVSLSVVTMSVCYFFVVKILYDMYRDAQNNNTA